MNQEQAAIDMREAYDELLTKLPHWGYCVNVDYINATCPNDEEGCKSCIHDKKNKLEVLTN